MLQLTCNIHVSKLLDQWLTYLREKIKTNWSNESWSTIFLHTKSKRMDNIWMTQNKILKQQKCNTNRIRYVKCISYICSSKVGLFYILTCRWRRCNWLHSVRMFWIWFTLWWGLNMSKNHTWQRTRYRNWMGNGCRWDYLCLWWGSRIMRNRWCNCRG